MFISLIEQGFRQDRTKKEIVLHWEYGNTIPDKFIIYRGKKNETVKIYKAVSGKENSFVDRDLEMDTEYVYKIKAVFSDGGQSFMKVPLTIKF